MIRRSVFAASCALILSAAWSTAQAPIIRNQHNPPLFQRFAAPVSGPIRFLLSDHGLSLVRRSRSPVAIAVLKALGEPLPAASGYPAAIPPDSLFSQPEAAFDANVAGQLATASSQIVPQPQAPVVGGCGADGTVFNLEPAVNAAPQNGESVDFIYNGVAAGADLVVSTANDFRGGLLHTFYYFAPDTERMLARVRRRIAGPDRSERRIRLLHRRRRGGCGSGSWRVLHRR